MKHRLYVIEGLPCSGKSTRYTEELLRKCCTDVRFFDEGCGEHPADYEFHAFLTAQQLEGFSADERAQIKQYAEQRCGGFVLPLSRFEGSLFDKLLKYKIYDMLPWETERGVMHDKWRSFVDTAGNDAVYVFNCCFMQNPMCESMMRFGFPQEVSEQFIRETAEITAPLRPVVIYLSTDEAAQNVRKATAEREGWLDAVIDYHVNGAYGRSIGAQGFEGYIACLEERQRRELAILSELPVERLVLHNAQRDWDAAYAQLERYISSAE